MSKKYLIPIDLSQNELQNAVVQNLASAPSSPLPGQIYYNTTSNTYQFYDGTQWQTVGTGSGSGNVTQATDSGSSGRMKVSAGANKSIADYTGGSGLVKSDANGVVSPATSGTDYAPATTGSTALKGDGAGGFAAATLNDVAAPTADYALAGHKLTNVGDPTNAQDAATKSYVDLATQGIGWKQAVRVATTTAGTLASSFANGQTVDGVALATGDRILIKDQADATENGIYVVAAAGAPSRASDADTGAKLKQAAVFVHEGTTNADSAWVCSNDGTITIGSTEITFIQFSSAGGVQNATTTTPGITRYATQSETEAKTVNDAAVTPDTLVTFPRKYSQTIGNGSSTSIAVTHNLGSKDVVAQVRDASTDAVVECDITQTSTSQTTFGFTVAPASNSIRVVIVG